MVSNGLKRGFSSGRRSEATNVVARRQWQRYVPLVPIQIKPWRMLSKKVSSIIRLTTDLSAHNFHVSLNEGEGACFGCAHPRAARDLGILLVRSAFTLHICPTNQNWPPASIQRRD